MARNNINLQDIVSTNNLYQAWRKLEKSISYTDVWYDETTFLEFKYKLDENIELIQADVLNGNYRLTPIRPIPFPKGSDENGPRVRLAYNIAMRDQLIWVALCNLLGPITEKKMPGWSFGNRLFVPMWKERPNNNSEKTEWRCGDYMNSYPFIYKKWKQSWPRFRKVLCASLKFMALGKSLNKSNNSNTITKDIIDENDEEQVEINSSMPDWINVEYLNRGYFDGSDYKHNLYWSSIDIKKFYPNIVLDRLKKILIDVCETSEDISNLISELLNFEVNVSGYTDEQLSQLDFNVGNIGLPTGLIVGGWLANVYLLPIDTLVRNALKENHHIIHLRYVDDHTFVSDSPQTLVCWMNWYIGALNKIDLKINDKKIAPKQTDDEAKLLESIISEGWRIFNEEEEKSWKKINKSMAIDPRFPSPLMTQTLQKVSQLSNLELRFLNPEESERVFFDLQSLVTVDFPEEEIKKETRISFASTMLSRMMVKESPDWRAINRLKHDFLESVKAYESNSKIHEIGNEDITQFKELIFERFPLISSIKDKKEQYADLNWDSLEKIDFELYQSYCKTNKKAKKVYHLLVKALHESPEKVNIWLRTLEMCFRHLPEKIHDLFYELKRLQSNNSIHELSRLFLERQMKAMCASRLLRETWRLFVEKHDSSIEPANERLLSSLISIKEIESPLFFVKDTNDLLKIALSFFKKIREGENSHIEHSIDHSFEAYWILSSYPDGQNLKFVYELVDFFTSFISDESNFNTQLAYKIAEICEMAEKDIPESISRIVQPYSNILNFNQEDCPHKGWQPLIGILKSESWQNSWLYKSEWYSCKIVSAIIKCISDGDKTQAVMKGRLPINLKNIYMEVKNWGQLKVEDCLKSEITVEITSLDVNDYFAQSCMIKNDTQYLGEAHVIFQLGVILYYLVSGNIPSDRKEIFKVNSYKWSGKIRQLESCGNVSTIMKNILSGCLLPFSFEQRRVDGNINPSLKKIQIMRITDLLKKLQEAEKSLKNRIIPRQELLHNGGKRIEYLELKVIEIN